MPVLLALLVPDGGAVSPRHAFEESYDNVLGGDWYRDYYDDYAPYLNGSESYVMQGLAAMFRATGDPTYLERLVWHADGVLAQRNDARGVTDWTGLESPCWRDMYYTGGRPFCWVLHSGVIIEPMVEFARLVDAHGMGDELAYDGLTFADKAATYVAAAEETVAWHDAEWSDAGYYVIPRDARFLGAEAGNPYPLNCSNAMGRALLVLHDVTGDPAYLDKATRLAEYFRDNLVTLSSGAYVWPYYGDDIIERGEAISYGALNARFASMAYQRGVVFTAADMDGFTRTLLDSIVVDDRTFHYALDGGETNYLGYEAEIYNWLHVAPDDPAVYTVVRNHYEVAYPAADNTSGGRLEGWATLAEFEPKMCAVTLGDGWADPDAASDIDWCDATTAEPTLVVTPDTCVVPLEVDCTTQIEVRGATRTHVWQATGGELVRYVPVTPGDTTFTLAHDATAGTVRVRQAVAGNAPAITSVPPTRGDVGAPLTYTPTYDGDAPVWWSLATFPTGARVDYATGVITYTPAADGEYPFTLRVANAWGAAEQGFVYCVGADCPEPVDTGADTGISDTGDTAAVDTAVDTDTDADPTDTDPADPAVTPLPDRALLPSACGCAGVESPASWGGGPAPRNAPRILVALGFVAAVSLARRRRSHRVEGRDVLVAVALGAGTLGAATVGCTVPVDYPSAQMSLVRDTAAPDTDTDTTGDTDTTETDTDTSGDTDTAPPDTATDTATPPVDADGDGHPVEVDCDDEDPWRHPVATDACDGVDRDCDGAIDEDCAVAVTGGQAHTCALLADGRAVCWGSDLNGVGDVPTEGFAQLDAGVHHTCGVTTSGEALCWGEDTDGQSTPADGAYSSVVAGYRASLGVTTDGTLAFWGSPYQGLGVVPADADIVSASCGAYHCCAVHASGEGECWGYWGLNTVPADTVFQSIATGLYHTCGITDAGDATCWGYGDDGRRDPPAENFSALACGAVHCCGLHDDGAVTCWGSDASGQSTPPPGETFATLSAGGYHTCGVTPDGTVHCWGSDAQGQSTVPVSF